MKSRGFEKIKKKSFSEGGVASPITLFMCILFLFTITSYSLAQDFTANTLGDYGNVTVMEVTENYDAKNPDGTLNSEPRQVIAKEFFRTHKDEYDFVVIFSNFDFQMPEADAKAFYHHVKNDIQGIGRQPFDYSSLFGSNGKLQGVIDMGNAETIVADPLDPKFEETLSILAHEQMHRWGAYVKFKDSNGNVSTALLGLNLEHWSFLLDSYGSVLYGNKWQDNGNGTFTSIAVEKYYSPLDLYLMGFNDKTQVPPMLLINNPGIDPARMPETGATITGTPRYIAIDDIITAEGERIPGSADSKKTFKTAFIFITTPGTFTGNELYGIENIRNGWVTRFSALTDGKGIMQVVATVIENIPVNPGPVLPPITPRTLPPNIEDGVKWLIANQKGDGSWTDLSQTTDRDTAEVVSALKNFSIAQQNYSLGSQWLSADDSENIDYLSRKIDAFANSGQDADALIALLISKQNPDGGWGSNNTYMSNPADTSLALKALSIAGSSNQTVISAAIEYLKLRQNTDGGWGNDDGGSTIEPTANVLSAFGKYRNNYQMEDQITKGLAWLIQRQNPDGGFAHSAGSGQASSTVYDTAVAVLTLREFNASTDITNNGINYILAQQSENDSWNGSPYQTALAVSAAWKVTVEPDLSVKADDITFIPASVSVVPSNIVMNVTMWNLGRTDVPQAKVVLYDGSVSDANKIGEQIVAFPGQSSVTMTFSVTITDGKEHRYYISIDPEKLVQESNKSNNTVLKILSPLSSYDFEILPSDISVSPNPVDIFHDVTITAKVSNKGTMNAYNVQLKYYIDDPQGAFDIATATVDIPAGTTITNESTWRANKAGQNLPVTVLADPFDTFQEISKENNKAFTYLTVNSSTEPNLTTSYKYMTITPNPVNHGGNANISALVKNEGFSPASNIKIDFYKGTPGVDGVLLGSRIIQSLNASESTTVSSDWTNILESGERIIYVKVDPDNQIQEIREDDNDAFTTLRILSLPDLMISVGSIVFSPPAPKEGDIVSVNVTIKNGGEQGVSDVTVRAYEGATLIGSQIISSIPGNSQASTSFPYDTTGKSGAHPITILIDPDNTVTEQSEDNNNASKTFGVQDANLWLTEQYISPNGDGLKDNTQFFFRLSAPQTVKVIIADGKGGTVRTFSGSEFNNTTSGNISWDGLDDNGMVVDDSQYQIRIVDVNNNVPGSLLVVVDNNRSPLTDAIGTKYLLDTNLTCMLPDIGENYWQWVPDEKGIFFYIGYVNQNTPEYPNGLYTMSPNGEDILRIVPSEWTYGINATYDDYYYNDYALSQDGEKVAFILNKYNKSSGKPDANQIWVVDRDGANLRLIDSHDLTQDPYAWINYLRWSPTGEYIIYMGGYPTELWIMKPDGTGKTKIDPDGGYIDFSTVRWSPDSQKIAYIVDTCVGWNCIPRVRISDVSGNRKVIFTMTGYENYFEWLNNTVIIASMPHEDSWSFETLWLIDTSEQGNHKKISDGLDEFSVSPDNKNIAFIEHDDNTVSVKSSDVAGNTTILHYTSYVPLLGGEISSDNVRNLTWSPDGRKVAFVDDTHGQTDACPSYNPTIKHYVPYLIVVDRTNGSKNVIKVGEAACITDDCMYSGHPECYTPGAGRFGTLLSYFQDNITMLVDSYGHYFAMNSQTGERSAFLPIDLWGYSDAALSPSEQYITYYRPIDQNSVCYSKGYDSDLWALSSLLNLTADLSAVKEKLSIILKGTAADLNFEEYMFEYADTNNPDTWNLISPPSDMPVINDVFTAWIPPYEGTFYVRLAVRDKAGNVAIKRIRISWGISSSVTNLYKSSEIFSPNNDGVSDTVELHYKVLEPVHLEFTIYDPNNNVIRTINRDYTAPANDYIAWDGRDGSGNIVPDGHYKIKVFDYEFFFEVDNTPPDVNIEISPLIETNETGTDGYFTYNMFYEVTLSGLAYDKNLKNWTIEYGKSDNLQEWFKVNEGGEILVKKDENGNPLLNPLQSEVTNSYAFTQVIPNDNPWNFFILNSIEELVGNQYRITAEDFVGNKRTRIGNMLEEKMNLIIAGCNEDDLFLLETIKEQTKSLTLQYRYEQGNPWVDRASIPYPSLKETVQPLFKGIPKEAFLRIKIVNVNDNEYYSDEPFRGCPDSDGPPPPDDSNKIDFSLDIHNTEANCGLLSDGNTVLSTRFTGLANVSLMTQSYYIQKPAGLQLLRKFDIATDGFGSVKINTLNMPEGNYPVKVILTSRDLSNNSIREISASNTLIVDRVLPTARITYPEASLMMCPITVPDSKGNWFGIPVEGIALDNIKVKRYELYYGIGDNPEWWVPAMTRTNGKSVLISVNGPKQGQIGLWDVTNLKKTNYSLKLKVTDVAGNVSCSTASFSVDTGTEIKNLAADKTLFSPNDDGVLDDVSIHYQIDEYATVDVKVFKLINESDNTYVLDSTSVRTIVSGFNHLGGTESTIWDGKNDSGAAVPDGLYGIAVFAKDSCGNTNVKWVSVEVDNTPPDAIITYPKPGDPLGNIIEISGTTYDRHIEHYTEPHFRNYILEAGQGDNPNIWSFVASGTQPVQDEIFGTWNTFGLAGIWTLRLTAMDTVGNKNLAIETIDLGQRKNLVEDLNAVPRLFSPNNDGKLDTTAINYSLTDSCGIEIDMLDSVGTLRKTYTTTVPSAGAYTFAWNGTDNAGTLVPDGDYMIKLHAALSANPAVTEDEAITVIVDSTPPSIDIKQPLNNSFLQSDVIVNGTISDTNLQGYSISYTGDAGTVLFDEANRNRENYVFGTIGALPEGNYILNVSVNDLAQNTTERVIAFTIDRTPPKVTLDTPKDGELYGSNNNSIILTGSIVEKNFDSFSLRYGPGDNPSQWTELLYGNTVPSNPQLFTWKVSRTDGIPDGLYTLSLYAKDRVALTGEARVKVMIDNNPPEVAITFPQDGGYVTVLSDIKGTATDQNFDKYTIELSEGQCASAYKWAVIRTSTTTVKEGTLASWQILPSDNYYCLRLTATDKAGNKSEAKVGFKVDTQPPAIPVLSGTIDSKTHARLTWTQDTDSDLAGYNLYRDAKKVNVAIISDSTYLDQNLKEGVYAYTVRALDLAGNESKPSNEVKLKVDFTPPTARINVPKDGSRVGGLLDIKGTSYSVDDFKQYKISISQSANPSSWNLIRTSPVPVQYGTLAQWDATTLPEVLYSIKLEAEDLSGNVNTQQVTVTVDNTPPAPPVLISAIPNGSDVALTWQANREPDLAGYLLYRNNQLANVSGIVIGDLKPYLITGATYLNKALPDGKFKYYLIAIDQAGNMSGQSNMIEVNIDTHPPHATIVDPMDRTKFQNKITVRADSPDLDIAAVQFQYKKAQDTAWINLGSPVSQTLYITYVDPSTLGWTYGDYNLRALASDQGGKTDPSPSFITVTYTDLAAPNAPTGFKALTNGKDVTLTWAANTETDLAGYNVYRTSGSSKTKINTAILPVTNYQDQGLADGAYTYEVTAVDTMNNESNPSNNASAKVYMPNIDQPYTPTGQRSLLINGKNVMTGSSAEIFVDAGSDPISQGAAPSDANGNFTFNSSLILGENRITARAKDADGNMSRTSDSVVVVYNKPPSPPAGLTKSLQDYNVTLTWNPDTESDLSGYNLFRNDEKLNMPLAIEAGAITASSYDYYNLPENALDSDTSSYWMSGYSYGTFNPVWWEIDLPSPELITHVEIHWFNDWDDNLYLGKDYEIQVWSGYAWITQTKVTGNAEADNVIEFKPSYRTDKIRIYITDVTSTDYYKQVGISEISILKDNLISEPLYQDANLHDGNYKYKVTAVDYYGFESSPSEEADAAVGDVTLPAAPLNLTATSFGSDVILNWSSNTESDLAGYNVYRNTPQGWIKMNAALVAGNAYTDANRLNGTYIYRVTALDAAGNESLQSNEASANVFIALPEPPFTIHVNPLPEGEALDISWEYSGGSSSGYNLYRSTTSGGPYIKLNTSLMTSTSYLDKGLSNSATYYYVVTAVDSIGNESAYSNEAVGIPSDTVAPHQPVIFFPTKLENPILLYNGKTDISGTAEPASVVELFRDGISEGKTTSLEKDILNSFPLDSSIYTASLSPDGVTLAYVYKSSIWLRNLATGDTTMLIQKGQSPVWVPDGRKLAYIFYDASNHSRIGMYDIETGTGNPLTDDTNVSENYPSWSADGTRIAFRSNKGSSWNAWIKDIETSSLKQVTNGISVSVMKLSPDGEKLAYFKSSEIYVIDLANNTTKQIDIRTDGYSLDWSPDSKKLGFISKRTGNSNLFLLDMNTQDQIQITDFTDYIFAPIWSPDGASIALGRLGNNGYSVWIMDAQANETGRALKQNLSYVDGISWVESGAIAFLEPTIFDVAYMEGYFNFKDIPLDPGENLFSAVSADESGNTSPPSDEISVIFDTDLLPDIGVTEDDISIYPPYPLAGQTAAVTAVIRNKGVTEVKDIDTEIYLWDSQGDITLIKSENLSSLSPGSEMPISFVINTTLKTGTNKIIVVIDPQDKIPEIIETNNLAIKEFFVAETEGVTLTTTLNPHEYGSNQDLNILIDLKNSGIEKDGRVETWVEDQNGQRVATIDTRTVHLPYAAEQNYSLLWNTGSTYAGSYIVHAAFKDAMANIITESTAPFKILPDMVVDSTVTTNKIDYISREEVSITINTRNSGQNYIIPGLNIKIKVTDASNNQVFTDNKNIVNLLPGSTVTLFSMWNTGLNPSGNYNIVVETYSDDKLIASRSVAIRVNTAVIITGSITVFPAVVAAGNSAQVTYSVQNTGNTSITGLPVSIVIIDPETQVIGSIHGDIMDLGVNATENGTFTFSTQGYALKTYIIALQVVCQGNTKTIATASFTVKDLTPPVVNIVSPISGNSFNSNIDITAIAMDDASGVARVEYQIDNAAWRLLPVSDPSAGRYSTAWVPTSTDNGNHIIRFRATDNAGNTSQSVSVDFRIQLDNTPPITTISVGTPEYNTYVTGGTIFTLSATDDISGVAKTEYAIDGGQYSPYAPFTIAAEGTHAIRYRSTDNAGNIEADKALTITVDNTPPTGSIIINDNAGYARTSVVTLTINALDGAGSGVAKMCVSNTASCDVWEPYAGTKPWTLSSGDGNKTIYVWFQDQLGNSDSIAFSSTIMLDTASPSSAISSPLSGATIMGTTITIKGAASDKDTLVQKVEISTDGGATWNSATSTISWSYEWTVPADGAYTIKSRATDSVGNIETPGPGTTVSVYKRQPTEVSTNSGQLLVNGDPFIIKGVVYSPVPIGDDPEIMPPYGDYFTSEYSTIYNRDLPLLRQMGADALRLLTWDGKADHHDFLDSAYNCGANPIYVIAGYSIKAGLDLDPGSPGNVREQIKADFRQMVATHKNHPAILMWAIGNDLSANSMYGGDTDNLFSLINEMAAEAHAEEGSTYHPVTAALADSNLISSISTYDTIVPSLDIWGANVYRGNTFGTLFDDFKAVSSRPLVILEYGIDAFDNVNSDEYENIGAPYQAIYAEALWNEIKANSDVCIGGSIMEYSDEWWKGKYSTDPGCPDNNPALHSICGYSISTETDEYTNDEWWGIMRTAHNDAGADTMETRVVYYTLQELWGGLTNASHISVSPITTNFGSVAVGATQPVQTITITDTGTDSIDISMITISGANASEFIMQKDYCSGHTLVPSKTCTLQVAFSPSTAGTKNATLSIPSDDPNTPTVYVNLSGTATISISGVVTYEGSPLSEVTMSLSGTASAIGTTDSSGDYKFAELVSGGYIVTPSKTGYTFTPNSSFLIISGANLTGQNFTGVMSTFTITPSAGSGGTISPSLPQTVSCNGTASFSVTPNIGYHIADVSADGVSQGAISSYTFTSVIANHTISASFTANSCMFGATGVTISGGGYVDSYDSSKGPYSGVHGANGPVGINSTAKGAITLSGSAKVYGDVWVGPGGDPTKVIKTSGGAIIYGTKGALSSAKDMTAMSDPGGGTPASFTNGTTLTSGTYRVSYVNLSGSGTGTINGNVTLYVTGSISVSGGAKIVILPGGSLTVYVSGSMNISGGGIVNQTLNPHTIGIFGTSTCTSANYSGSSALFGTIHAPKASTTLSGGSSIYGSVVGKSVTMSGGAAVHCDESL